jgi:bacterioferritin
MIREDLVAERIAVESYSEIVRDLGDNDPTSKRMLEEILAKARDAPPRARKSDVSV